MRGKRALFVFDFDQTIMNLNTDTYIVNCLPEKKLPQEIQDLAPKGWNKFMQTVLKHINESGVTIKQQQDCLRQMELTPGFEKIMQFMKQNPDSVDSVIVSDSNQFFIETILEHLRYQSLFKHVFTNPCQINHSKQEIIMTPYHSHSCPTPTCPKNLCKRSVLMGWQPEVQLHTYDRIFYFGDGQNDYCPLKLLRAQDVVFSRRGYTLDKLVNQNKTQCQVFSWENGHQIIESVHFKTLLS